MKAIVFPGQGAQYVGMGKSFYDKFPEAKTFFSAIDNAVGFTLSSKCFYGPQEDLKDTSIQQLAILATSLVAFEVFKRSGFNIDYLSGLSLGEYSCLYVAGVLSLNEVFILVKERALAMQKAAQKNPSTMLAILGLDYEVLKEKSKELHFYIANLNAPGQVVISLKKEDKDKIRISLEELGAKVIELAVSGGFHSPFMEPAAKHLEGVIRTLQFQDAKIPIVSNFTAQPHQKREEIKKNLINQLISPVLWKDCIEFMSKTGVETFFEIGPSKVLRGLMRKIDPGLKIINIEKKEDIDIF